ncbi:MAG: GTPase ObgE [Bacilli bacterium]|jgi:GTP-binding protein|nr:GTPase ObgE [Bacilli bacterium]
MFIDRVKLTVKSGKGGDGMIAFLHEKYMPKGGPSGGNGGRGASIVLKASSSINTLFGLYRKKIIRGNDGEKGNIKNQYGRGAKDVIIDVPVGTIVYEAQTHNFLFDLNEEGAQYIVAKGGRGGRGNAAFKSSRNRVPRIAENGVPGEEKEILLELKLLADVGLVGFPNVGKSTLLSVVTNANPEIADYPFTTTTPNLGVVSVDNTSSFVMADLPGLIEGAHGGKGLGLTFLRHIERCRVIIHMIDLSGQRDPYDDYLLINQELEKYGYNLTNRPTIICGTKMDEDGAEKRRLALEKQLKTKVIGISALTHEGLKELVFACSDLLSKTPKFPIVSKEGAIETIRIYDAYKDNASDFNVVLEKEGQYRIVGEKVERTYHLINLSTDEGILKLMTYLRKIGVEERLQKIGAKDGDTVILCDFEFEYIE